ncbi:sugar phosphate isomerase/epimerase family protein [Phenylobacterium sp. VNQ135]|uniref:sugar phosphate isomerase/epimerase family protein n=1 Tax=Phenylobacterium sp. VNQ135 TaxID=3400922 RepID=UPI003C048971
MRLSVSNIAWDIADEPAAADMLSAAGITCVDVAPGKYFADPAAATVSEIEVVRRWWADRGFQIVGMQGLLFGTTGLNLFQDDGTMLDRLAAQCRVGGLLSAQALVFGSPKQRDRTGLDEAKAQGIAVDFFRRLGDAAAQHGVLVCLEANPAMYGCNFMVRTDEAAAMVRAVDHPAVRLQLDVGTMGVEGEDPAAVIAAHADLFGHAHASEPGLVTVGEAGAPHAVAAETIRRLRPDLTVTVEMATQPDGLAAVTRAVAAVTAAYGDAA